MKHFLGNPKVRRIGWAILLLAIFFAPGDRLIEPYIGTAAGQQTTFIGADSPKPVITEGFKSTYSTSSVALVTPASATDVFCISPSASKTVKVNRVQVSAVGSAIITIDASLRLNLVADTGGTAALTTAAPNLNVSSHDPSVDPAATATLIAYTAVPTISGTATIIRSQKLVANISVQAVGTVPPTVFDFTTRNGKAITLRKGTTVQLCLNLGTGTIAAPLVDIDMEWTEEN